MSRWIAAGVVLLSSSLSIAQVRVVTTIPDFADIAAQIGGAAVTTISLTKGHEDLHLVRIRPSLLVKLRRADVFVQLGLDGEHSWVPAMMRTARNSRIQPGAAGFCDASVGITPLDVPANKTRGAGPDLHPIGNPHYNLDPMRMRRAARNIRDCLIRVAPNDKARFEKNCLAWERELDERLERWRRELAPLRGATFFEAHSSWVYFADTFGLRIAGRLEPSPGTAPTADHLSKLIVAGKRQRVGLVVGRAGFADVAERVAKGIGAESAQLPISSATSGELQGWFVFMDHCVATFARHLKAPRRAKSGDQPATRRGRTPASPTGER